MNTKRMILWAMVLTLVCWSGTVMAANTVVIPSQSVALGATGVVIPILITNDLLLKGITMPLALREQTPGAFVTSITMAFADRLPAGGPISELSFRNQYAEEDGLCKQGFPGGFGTITSATGGPNAVVASPEGVLFVRQKLFSPSLAPGTDATGSMVLTVDVTSVDGTFEIDTTCANPASHLLYVKEDNTPINPDFTKGIITIGNPVSNNPPDAVCQDVSVDADADCLVDVAAAAVDGGSSDPDGDPFTLRLNPEGPYGAGPNTVWLVATDDSGDSDSCQATITVNDVTNPVIISCPGDVSVQCSADIPPADIGAVVATDNCGVIITHEGDASDAASCPETITRTYRATDPGGNFVECTQTITVNDDTPPQITGCPGLINIDCAADIPAPNTGLVTATDNCGTPAITFVSDVSDNLSCPETITRTYRATDLCGNTADCIQTITVLDTQAPELVGCPGDITVSCLADVPAAANVTAIDNCDGGIAVDFAEVDNATGNPCGGTIVRTWSAVDACGNPAECSQTITVSDTEVPVITCIGSQTAFVDANCEALLPDLTVDAVLTLTDNCTAPASIVVTQDPPSGTLLGTGILQVTLFAEDACGNVAQCSFDYITEDNTPPTITCPNNITVPEDSPGNGAVVTWTAPGIVDNCPGGSVAQIAGPVSGSTFIVGPAVTITYEVTDAAGNTQQCSFTVTVTEGIPPLVALCQDITVDADANCEAAVTPAQVDNGSSGSNIVLALDPPGPYGLGPNLVELVVTDDQGGEERCPATITVEDNTAPSIACPADIVVDNDAGECGAIVSFVTTFDDNCPGATLDCVPASGSFFDVGVTPVTCTVTDASGNTNECTFSVTVNDTEQPTITCPGNITIQEDSPGTGAVVSFADPTFDDNCPGATLEQLFGPPSGSTFPVGLTVINFQVTDAAGLTNNCTFTITVTEGIPPLVALCQNVTVDADANCEAAVAPAQVDNGSSGSNITLSLDPPGPYALGVNLVELVVNDDQGGEERCSATITVEDNTNPEIVCTGDWLNDNDGGQCGSNVDFEGANWATATDDCGSVGVTYDPPSGFFPVGTTPVIATATDGAGNTSSCSFNVIITDTEDPTITCPSSAVVLSVGANCDVALPDFTTDGLFTVDDNCSVPGPLTVTQSPVPGTIVSGVTSLFVTLTVTDPSGNTGSCQFEVITVDDTAPTAECPADITAPNDGGQCGAVVTWSATILDNCPGGVVTCDPASGSFFPVGTTEVFCSAVDEAGNASESDCSFFVTVEDVEDPVAECPVDIDVDNDPGQCGAIVSFLNGVQQNDNCGVVSFEYVPASGSFFDVGTTIVTGTATDEAGNTGTCTFEVRVHDAEAPVATCPADIYVDVDAPATERIVEWVSTVDDNCPGATIACIPASGSLFPVGSTPVECVATDEAGNTNSCFFTVYVNQVENPILDADPDTIFVSAIVDGPNPGPSQAAVNNIGTGGPIAYYVCEEVSWLDVNPLDGFTDSFFDISYDITGLTPQVYYGKICVSEQIPNKIIACCPEEGLRDSVIVELTILAQCDQAVLTAEPSSLTFYSRDCERGPLCETITIDSDIPDCNLSWFAETDAPWITSIDPSNGLTPSDVQVCVDPSGLAPGIYHSAIDVYIGDVKGVLASLSIPVTLKVEDAVIFMTDVCGSPGDIVNLCINYCTNVDLSGLSVGLCYDSDLIRVIDATFEGSAVQQYSTVWSVDDVAQTICLAAFPIDQEPIDSGCGLFATVHFEILGGCPEGASIPIFQCDIAPGESRVNGSGCELLATDTELESFCINFEPGTICVECPCSICGTVYENGDGPLANALVQIWDAYPGGNMLGSVLTNEGGGFCFDGGIEPGIHYVLRVVAEGYCTYIYDDIMCGGENAEIGLDPLPVIPSRPFSASWWSNNATNEGFPLLPGDVILAMDPQGNIVGLDIVSVAGQYLIDVVSDDPTTPGVDDGANEGETITLLLDCVCPLQAPGEWTAFGNIQFDADFDCRLQPVEIPLCDSWTLVSFNVLPPDPAVGTVLSSIDGLYDYLLSATCETGNDSWAKDRPTNDLNMLDPWHGFWIKPSTSGVGPVIILGSYILPDTPLDLCEGWNVISYLPSEADDLAHALASIDGKYTYVISSECDGPHSWAADRDPLNNDLFCLKPGLGYWIYMTEAASLTYPTSGYNCSQGGSLSAGLSQRVTITPRVADIWSEADASVSGLQSGDRVTVRTQTGAVCGETVVGPNGMFLVHVFGDDPTTDYVDGAHEGEELIVEVNGVAATVTSGAAVFNEKRSTEITVQAAGAGPLPRDYALLQNYPNPFNPSTTIAFRMPEASDVTITVYNVLGQPVRTVFTGYLPAGSHSVEWDGRFDNGQTAQSGIYLYRLLTAGWSDAKKMTLVK